jgi:hypothetical protein
VAGDGWAPGPHTGQEALCARGPRRVQPAPGGQLNTHERWALVSDGARVSDPGRYQAPRLEPRTVRIEGRCAYVKLHGRIARVDQLVAGTFMPLPAGAPAMQLVHIDDDCHNDALANLQWMPPAESRRHAADPTRALSTTYKHCPLPATRELLLQQARLAAAPHPPAPPPEAEVLLQLEAHRNPRGLCPSVSSWGGYRAAGKDTPHCWRGGQPRSISLNGQKVMLDRLVAYAFVPKHCALVTSWCISMGSPRTIVPITWPGTCTPRATRPAPQVRSIAVWIRLWWSEPPPTTAARRALPHGHPAHSRPAALSTYSGRARARCTYL